MNSQAISVHAVKETSPGRILCRYVAIPKVITGGEGGSDDARDKP